MGGPHRLGDCYSCEPLVGDWGNVGLPKSIKVEGVLPMLPEDRGKAFADLACNDVTVSRAKPHMVPLPSSLHPKSFVRPDHGTEAFSSCASLTRPHFKI
jgi:hypothetical protein